MRPLISIIVPVYNAEKTLARCLDSVLEQRFQDFEVILVDDGSQDSSGILCDQYHRMDGRICVIHQANAGVSAARNVGIEHAQGEYLLFLDSDDALEDDALRSYEAASGAGAYDVVIGSLSLIEEGICTRKIGMDQEVCAGSEIWQQICTDPGIFGYAGGKMIRTGLVQSNGIVFNLHMRSQEDMDFFLSAYGFCNRFRLIPDPVYRYYYAPTKRTPPVWDFIANQLKMLRIGKSRTNLSEEAQSCVHKRILSLLYTGLYDAADRATYDETVEKLIRVEGLSELLKTVPAKGEHAFVARSFAVGKYGRILWYFRVRNRIRDIARMFRKK